MLSIRLPPRSSEYRNLTSLPVVLNQLLNPAPGNSKLLRHKPSTETIVNHPLYYLLYIILIQLHQRLVPNTAQAKCFADNTLTAVSVQAFKRSPLA